jgi:hypothetical protein
VGGAIAGVLADRSRARLAAVPVIGAGPAVQRVDRLVDPVRLGVHPAEALERGGTADRVPPFIPRDRLPEVESALREGGFLLLTGDSTAGKTRLAFEALRGPPDDRPQLRRGAIALRGPGQDCVMERGLQQDVYCRRCGVRLRRIFGRWFHVRTLGPVGCRRPEPEA